LRKVRALSDAEGERYLAGEHVGPGEIVREDVLAARREAHVSMERAIRTRRPERAEQAAARARREAEREP
jgi:hypothetical protein